MGVAQKVSGLGSQPDSLCLSGKLGFANFWPAQTQGAS